MIELLSSGAAMPEEAYEAQRRWSSVVIKRHNACPPHKGFKFGSVVYQLHSLKVALPEPAHSLLADSLQGILTQIHQHEFDGAYTETFD